MKIALFFVKLEVLAALISGLILGLSPGELAQPARTTWELQVCANEDNLPYSNRQQQGLENRIADMVAEELHARLTYVWLPALHSQNIEIMMLRQGECDLFMGVSAGSDSFLTTLAYYRSTFVFVIRDDAPFAIQSLNDELLRTLRIGVLRSSPPDFALIKRGIIDNVQHYFTRDPLRAIIEDVANDTIDVGIVWGPVAGYFAKQQPIELELTHVMPQIDMPFLPMVNSISMGVRTTDVAFRDLLNRVIALRWDDIQAVLMDYGVPRLPLPKPAVNMGGV